MLKMRFCVVLTVALGLASVQLHATNVNPFTDLNNGAGPGSWRVLTLGICTTVNPISCDQTGNNNVSLSSNSQIVEGNVGVGPHGNIALTGAGSAIRGDLDLQNGTIPSFGSGTNIFGTINNGVSGINANTILNTAVASALVAYNDARNDAATIGVTNIGNLGTTQTINVGDGLNVINLSNLTLTTGGNLVLNATGTNPSTTTVVINVTGTFTVINDASITESGGLPNYNVLINVVGTGTGVCITGGSSASCSSPSPVGFSTVDAVILSPDRTVAMDAGVVDGEVIAGGTTTGTGLTLTKTSTIDAPEPATLLLVSTGLTSLYLRRRRRKLS